MMGGTGVASARVSNTLFFNLAMLAEQREKEDFALLIGGGVRWAR